MNAGPARPRSWRGARRAAATGHTFIELLVTAVILSILATAALPIAAASRRREKEIELRRSLRTIRQALAVYHTMCLASTRTGIPTSTTSSLRIKVENDLGLTCYPESLDVLVEGVKTNAPDFKVRFLRQIPRDPFNVDGEEHDEHGWKLVSSTDREGGSMSWNEANVMNVASSSEREALDGSYYKDW